MTLSISGNYFNVSQPAKLVTKEVILGYYAYMRNLGTINEVTMRTRMSSMRAFLYFCMRDENDFIDSFKIKLWKMKNKLKVPYTDDEMTKLLKKPNLKICKFTEYRNWVVVNICFGIGIRLGTVIHIKISDLDLDNSNLYVFSTKNGEQVILPLPAHLVNILREYLIYRKQFPGTYLFCTTRGDRKGARMTERGMQNAIATYNLSHGVSKTSIHLYRHRFSKDYALKTRNSFKLQRLLIHNTSIMASRYVNIWGEDLKDGYDEDNPLENFNRKKRY